MKRKLRKSTLAGFGSISFIIIVVLVYTIIPVFVDFGNIFSSSFLSDLILSYGLALLSTIALCLVALYRVKEIDESPWNKSHNKVLKCHDILQERKLSDPIDLYCKKYNREEKIPYFTKLLYSFNIDKKYADVTDWTISDIKTELKNKKINKEQFKILEKIKNGRIKFEDVSPEILKVDGFDTYSNSKFHGMKFKIGIYRGIAIAISMFIMATITTSMVIDSLSGVSSQEIIVKTISRLITVLTSCISGYMLGNTFIRDDIRIFGNKAFFINNFITAFDTGIFIPYEEEKIQTKLLEAKKEYEEKNNPTIQEQEDEDINITEEEWQKVLKDRKLKERNGDGNKEEPRTDS